MSIRKFLAFVSAAIFTAAASASAQLPTFIDLGEGVVPVEINEAAFIAANIPGASGNDTFLFVPGTGVIPLTSNTGLCRGTVSSVGEFGTPYGETTCQTNGPGNVCSFSLTPISATIDQNARVLGSNIFGDLVGSCIISCQAPGLFDIRACAKFAGDSSPTYFQFNTGPERESGYATAITPRNSTLGATYVVGLAGDEVVSGNKQNHGFFWTENFGMQNIDTITGQKFIPTDVSLTQDVAGYLDSSGMHRAAIFNPITPTLTPLGTFGGAESEAAAVTDSSVAVGKAQDSTGTYHAFVYNGLNPIADLNWVNPNPAFLLNEADDINNGNDIVGVATNVSTGRQHGFALLQRTGFPFISLSGSCARKPPRPGKKCSFRVIVNDFFGRTKKNEVVVIEASRQASIWGPVAQLRSSSSRHGKTVSIRVNSPNFYRARVFGINGKSSFSNLLFVTPVSHG